MYLIYQFTGNMLEPALPEESESHVPLTFPVGEGFENLPSGTEDGIMF